MSISKMAIGIVFFPFSWRFGPWDREKKFLFAVGPLRLVIYKNPGEWKEAAHGA